MGISRVMSEAKGPVPPFILAYGFPQARAVYPPALHEHRASNPDDAGILDLAIRKMCGTTGRPVVRWSLTPPFHPYLKTGGYFLSHYSETVRSPETVPPGVTRCGALYCPDFPHTALEVGARRAPIT